MTNEAAASRSLGSWRVSNSSSPIIPWKAIVEFVLEPDAFAIHLGDSTIRVGYDKEIYTEYSCLPGEAAVRTEGGLIRVEPMGSVTQAELKRELEARRPAKAQLADGQPAPWVTGVPPATLIRSYRAKNQVLALEALQHEAPLLAQQGYVVQAQMWAPGQWGVGAFVLAVLLCFVFVGFFVMWYLLIIKPDGALNVTYVRQEALDVDHPPAATTSTAGNLVARLAQIVALRDSGTITEDEYAAKRAEIIKEL